MKIVVFTILFTCLLASSLGQSDPVPTCGEEEDLELYEEIGLEVNLGADGNIVDQRTDIDGNIEKLYAGDDYALAIRSDMNAEADAPASDVGGLKLTIKPYYYATCPAKWYKVNYWQWYYLYEQKKCYAIHNYWITKCYFNYCRISFSWDQWWWYHRCYPEYRLTYIPVVCVDADGVWTKSYIRRYIPRGCCCRRFWRYGFKATLQCPAGGK